MSEGWWVIEVDMPGEATRDEADAFSERIARLCRNRHHWWQVWRRRGVCEWGVITRTWHRDDQDVAA